MLRIKDNSSPSAFRRFCANRQRPVSRINVARCEQEQFFSSQGSFICQQQHDAIAYRFGSCGFEKTPPLVIAGDPWQFVKVGNECAITLACKPFSRGVMTSTDGVIDPHPLVHEVVVKQARRGEAQVHGSIRESLSWLHRRGSVFAWPRT